MAKDKRVEILFEPTDYERLSEIARREHKSVGSVVREAVAKYVTSPADETRRKAFEWLTTTDTGIDWGTPEELSKWYARTKYESIMKSMGPEYEPLDDERQE